MQREIKVSKTYPDGESMAISPKRKRYYNTGEHRPPKKGERYLSGARPVAYIAPNDFSEGMEYYIARPCKEITKVVTTITVMVEDN